MSDLVGNPEDRFSRVAAHIMLGILYFMQNIIRIKNKFCIAWFVYIPEEYENKLPEYTSGPSPWQRKFFQMRLEAWGAGQIVEISIF